MTFETAGGLTAGAAASEAPAAGPGAGEPQPARRQAIARTTASVAVHPRIRLVMRHLAESIPGAEGFIV
jgi:hypothetical protein